MSGVSRRGFLGLVGVAGVAAVGAATPWLSERVDVGHQLRSRLPLPRPFDVELPIPPVLRPARRTASTDRYEITQRATEREILPGHRTEIWGYNGEFPGPTIVSHSGKPTVVTHHNKLPVPTVVHLHGGHTPAASDGYPTDFVLPASGAGSMAHAMRDRRATVTHGSREYTYPMKQRTATLWYHDHRMDFTGASVWRGLAGFHLIEDGAADRLGLPAGRRDVPLMIVDRSFGADAELIYPSLDPTLLSKPGVHAPYTDGVLGDVILVNGAPWPRMEVDAARYRFRILNASNARRYSLALDPPASGGAPGLVQVGSDGGLLQRPIRHEHLDMAPAERFDVVIDFSRYRVGQRITLVNRLGSGSTARVMQFHVVRKAADDSRVPSTLSTIEPLDTSGAPTQDIKFELGADGAMWKINGKPFDPNRTDTVASLGRTQVWNVYADFAHPFHVHHNQFQVLGRNGGAPGPFDAGWKDTVSLDPTGQITLAVRFDDYAGRFLYHCHNLEHEDMAMMANLQIRR